MYQIVLDTSTKLLYVAIIKGDKEIVKKTRIAKKDHASYLPSFVNQVIKEAKITPKDLKNVIIGKGLGSYTGLRVSGAFAKVFAYSLNIPLYSISSLFLLSSGENKKHIAYQDARRERIYLAGYDKIKEIIKDGIYPNALLESKKVEEFIKINLGSEEILKKLKPFNYKLVLKKMIKENTHNYEPRYK